MTGSMVRTHHDSPLQIMKSQNNSKVETSSEQRDESAEVQRKSKRKSVL